MEKLRVLILAAVVTLAVSAREAGNLATLEGDSISQSGGSESYCPTWSGTSEACTELELLETFAKDKGLVSDVSIDLEKRPLRLPVREVYDIKKVGTISVGKVDSGTMSPEMEIGFCPSRCMSEVESMEMQQTSITQAGPGDNDFGFFLAREPDKGLGKGAFKGQGKKGQLQDRRCVSDWRTDQSVVYDATKRAMRATSRFRALIRFVEHPSDVKVGYSFILHIHTARTGCTLERIHSRIDPVTGKTSAVGQSTAAQNQASLSPGDVAVVTLSPMEPLCVERYDFIPELGRFKAMDGGATFFTNTAVGLVLDTHPEESDPEMTEEGSNAAVTPMAGSAWTPEKIEEFKRLKRIVDRHARSIQEQTAKIAEQAARLRRLRRAF